MYELTRAKSSEFSYKEGNLHFAGMPVTTSAKRDLCGQHKVPYTLFSFQERTPIDIIEPVLRTLPAVEAVTSEGVVESFVHPSKSFITDAQVAEITEKLSLAPLKEFKVLDLDIFQATSKLDRPLTGGLTISLGLLRLACTNGMQIFHPECTTNFNAMPDVKVADSAISKVTSFTPEDYLQSVFGSKKKLRPASVANLLDMARSSGLPQDELSSHFPIELVREHYASKGYDIDKLSRKTLNSLSAGLSYYDAFNFLTYVMTHKRRDKSLQDQIEMAKYLGKASAKDYEHMLLAGTKIDAPEISSDLIERLKGDK